MSLLGSPEKQEHRTVVSLKTEIFKKGRGFTVSKVLTTLKRKSKGFDILSDGISEEIEDMGNISGLHTLPDGVYQLKYANTSRDYESGNWEHDGYELLPYSTI
jgi:hypothetical protein